MSRTIRIAALALSLSCIIGGAVPVFGAAPLGAGGQRVARNADTQPPVRPRYAAGAPTTVNLVLPAPVYLKESDGRGLVVDVWINGRGPFKFAVDTGAGGNLISQRVVTEANVPTHENVALGGLSGTGDPGAREAGDMTLALGAPENRLPTSGFSLVATGLPADLDGILDPTEVFFPFGFVLDYPRRELRAFDPETSPVRLDTPPANGAVVEWVSEEGNRRPFVLLSDGRRALLDTGSRFGLAIGEQDALARGIPLDRSSRETKVSDITGATIVARRVQPTSIQLGPMVLSNVPTDVLSGLAADAPVILGRDALRPFVLTFDPRERLIGIAPQAR